MYYNKANKTKLDLLYSFVQENIKQEVERIKLLKIKAVKNKKDDKYDDIHDFRVFHKLIGYLPIVLLILIVSLGVFFECMR